MYTTQTRVAYDKYKGTYTPPRKNPQMECGSVVIESDSELRLVVRSNTFFVFRPDMTLQGKLGVSKYLSIHSTMERVGHGGCVSCCIAYIESVHT